MAIGKNDKDGNIYIYLDFKPWPEVQDVQFSMPATYVEIKSWISRERGLKVTDQHIAQVKRKHCIIRTESQNKPRTENMDVPPDKEAAIEAAFRHFGMISGEN